MYRHSQTHTSRSGMLKETRNKEILPHLHRRSPTQRYRQVNTHISSSMCACSHTHNIHTHRVEHCKQHISLKVTQETHTHGNIYSWPLLHHIYTHMHMCTHTNTILKLIKAHNPEAEIPRHKDTHRETDTTMKTNHAPHAPHPKTHAPERPILTQGMGLRSSGPFS